MININRVAKVVKGGRRFSFSALVVVGNEVDTVGIGYGKAKEVPLAIQKAVDDARKNLFVVPKYKTTITHDVVGVAGRLHGQLDAVTLLLDHARRGLVEQLACEFQRTRIAIFYPGSQRAEYALAEGVC